MTTASSTILVGGTDTVTLTARDASGHPVTGALAVTFGLGAGSSGGTFGAVTNHGDGTYTATFTAAASGTPAPTVPRPATATERGWVMGASRGVTALGWWA